MTWLLCARLGWCSSEGNAGKPMDEALLKQITGRDPVTARFLRKEFFTFTPRFQIFLATNKKPKFLGADEGLWRRVKLVAWNRTFAPHERDAGIFNALLEESEGILAWAVRGAVEWYAGGLQDPPAIKEATAEYKASSDVLAGFLPGMYVRDENASEIPGKTVFDDYLAWAAEENLKPAEVVKRNTFYSLLEERVSLGTLSVTVRRSRVSVGLVRVTGSVMSREPAVGDAARCGDLRDRGCR